MDKFIKDNIIFFILVIAALVGGICFIYTLVPDTIEAFDQKSTKEHLLEEKQNNLKKVELQKAQEAHRQKEKKEAESGKVIYEVLGQQFSSEASFGIMFENILSNLSNSGVRIRKIDYNYKPNDDKILMTNLAGYNACELNFITVSTYAQLQNFFKNLTKEKYLTNITEIYLEPYDKDKTILIANFKVRLYTKTI